MILYAVTWLLELIVRLIAAFLRAIPLLLFIAFFSFIIAQIAYSGGAYYLPYWLLNPWGFYGADSSGDYFRMYFFRTAELVLGLMLFFYVVAPQASSLLSFLGFNGGGYLTRYVLGARQLSEREQAAVDNVFTQIVGQTRMAIVGFNRIYVLDSPVPLMYLIGTTLYVSSSALHDNPHLPAMLAHELGHINHRDGGSVLALRRLVFPLYQMLVGSALQFSTRKPNKPTPDMPYPPEFDEMAFYFRSRNRMMLFFLSFWGGGLGVWLLSSFWAVHFRRQDYYADAFALQMGYREALLAYLEETRFHDASVPYMQAWQPANELRIDEIKSPGRHSGVEYTSFMGWEDMFRELWLNVEILFKMWLEGWKYLDIWGWISGWSRREKTLTAIGAVSLAIIIGDRLIGGYWDSVGFALLAGSIGAFGGWSAAYGKQHGFVWREDGFSTTADWITFACLSLLSTFFAAMFWVMRPAFLYSYAWSEAISVTIGFLTAWGFWAWLDEGAQRLRAATASNRTTQRYWRTRIYTALSKEGKRASGGIKIPGLLAVIGKPDTTGANWSEVRLSHYYAVWDWFWTAVVRDDSPIPSASYNKATVQLEKRGRFAPAADPKIMTFLFRYIPDLEIRMNDFVANYKRELLIDRLAQAGEAADGNPQRMEMVGEARRLSGEDWSKVARILNTLERMPDKDDNAYWQEFMWKIFTGEAGDAADELASVDLWKWMGDELSEDEFKEAMKMASISFLTKSLPGTFVYLDKVAKEKFDRLRTDGKFFYPEQYPRSMGLLRSHVPDLEKFVAKAMIKEKGNFIDGVLENCYTEWEGCPYLLDKLEEIEIVAKAGSWHTALTEFNALETIANDWYLPLRHILAGDGEEGESIDGADVFLLTGYLNAEEEKRGRALEKLIPSILDIFDKDTLETLVDEEAYAQYRDLRSENGILANNPVALVEALSFLQTVLPDAQDRLQETALELKRGLFALRVNRALEDFEGQTKKIKRVKKANRFLKKGKWRSAANVLNALFEEETLETV